MDRFLAIYREAIETPALAGAQRVEKPRALFMGGQPGCGKSTAAKSCDQYFGIDGYVHVDVDRVRVLHPAYLPLVTNSDTEKMAPSAVQKDCSLWSDMLVTAAVANRRNVLVDGGMRVPAQVRVSAVALRAAGYEVEARIMAVHEKASEVSLLQRFEHEKQRMGFGRTIPFDYHAKAAAGIIDTVHAIEEDKLFDHLVIFDRAGKTVYENRLVGGEWEQAPCGAKTMDAFRCASYDLSAKKEIAGLWDDVVRMMVDRGAGVDELAPVINLRDGAKEIADMDDNVMKKPMDKSQTFLLVDGLERPAQNSNGLPIHWSEEGVRNFWRWFGDSNVVDTEGRPLVMYHGTTVWDNGARQLGDITEFNRKASTEIVRRSASIDQVGSWFSDTPDEKVGGGMYAGQNGMIYPVYLKISDSKRTTFTALTRTAYKLAHGDLDEIGIAKPRDVEPYRTWAKEMGYDGLKLIHDPVREAHSNEFKHQNVYVVFDSIQIKSAIGNDGKFDRDSAHIALSSHAKNKNVVVGTDDSKAMGVPLEGTFSGKILDVADGVVVQKVGRDPNKVERHAVSRLTRVPAKDEVVNIKYLGGVGEVSGKEVGICKGR